MKKSKLVTSFIVSPMLLLSGCGTSIVSTSSVISQSSSSSATSSEITSSVVPQCIEDTSIPTIEAFRAVPSIDVAFWHGMGQLNQAIIDGYITGFKALFPNVNITQLPQGGYDDLASKTAQAIRAGTAPALVQTYPDHVAGYLEAQAVVNMSGYACSTSPEISIDLNDFVDSYIQENMQWGSDALYGIPFNKSTEVLVYNKTRFDEWGISVPSGRAPSWDEVAAWAQTIKDETGKFAFAYDSSENLFITLTRQWGGQYTTRTGAKVRDKVLFNNDQTKAALQYYKDKRADGLFTLPLEWEKSFASDALKVEDTFMAVGSSGGINYNVPANNAFEVGVLPIPQKSEETKSVIQQGTNLTILADTTPEQRLASWLFIRYVTNIENTIHWAMETGYMPVRKSAITTDTFEKFLGITDSQSEYYLDPAERDSWSLQNEIYFEKYNNRSKSINVAYLQTDYLFYDPAFVSSSRIRELAGFAAEDTILGTMTPSEAILQAISQLPLN